MLPSKNITTHFAVIDKENKNIPITIEQADWLREMLKSSTSTKYISIPDPNNPLWEPLWEWRAGNITITKAFTQNQWARYICDFWTRHSLHEDCTCQYKYKVYPIQFTQAMYKMFPWMYAWKLSESQKMSIIKSITN